jgi:hypothetical protein
MQKLLFAVVLIAAVALATQPGATPTTPQWPDNFAASVFANKDNGQPSYFRWFYSETTNQDRFDTMAYYNGENWFNSQIWDHNSGYGYNVFWQMNTEVCFFAKINGTVPHPSFASFTYLGQSTISFEPAYMWFYYNKTADMTFTYYESQSASEPLRLDFYDGKNNFGEQWYFYEFDETDQDPSLYLLPEEVVATCNRIKD